VAFFFARDLNNIDESAGFTSAGWWQKGGEMSRLFSAAALTLAFCGICNAAQFQKIVLSGEQAPALPSGTQFMSFNSVQLDAAGNVGFSASTTGLSGIWRFHVGDFEKVVLAGEAAPGRDGLLSGFSRFILNAAGDFEFVANTN